MQGPVLQERTDRRKGDGEYGDGAGEAADDAEAERCEGCEGPKFGILLQPSDVQEGEKDQKSQRDHRQVLEDGEPLPGTQGEAGRRGGGDGGP